MVLLRSDLKCPFEGRLDSDWMVSELKGTTTFTSLAKFALIKAVWMFVAAPITNG